MKLNFYKVINIILISTFIVLIFLLTRYNAVSWNDRSRFASIQSIVENKSFVIDNSLFTTGDKVMINGKFYSDKPPIFSLFASIPYYLLNKIGFYLIDHDRLIIYATNIFSLLVPLLIYIFVLFLLIKNIHIKNKEEKLFIILILIISTALLPYSTQLNNHLPASVLVGIASAIFYFKNKYSYYLIFLNGILIGFASTFDMGVSFIAISYLVFLLIKKAKFQTIFLYLLGLSIPLLIHYFVNIQITGDIFPASMHSEFFQYEGSVFSSSNLTSNGFAVSSFREFILYAWHMTFGIRGFFLHNPVIIFGLVIAFLHIIKNNNIHRAYSITALLSIFMIISYYTLYGKGASGSAYLVRWFLIMIPILIPLIFSWLLEIKKQTLKFIFYLFVALSIPVQISAMGNILGPANNFVNFHFLNMFRAFPGYFLLHFNSIVNLFF